MKNIVLSFSLLLLSVAAMAAPRNVTRTLSIREFDEIEASFFKVEVIPGKFTGEITVTGPRETLDLLSLTVRGDKLSVGLKDDKSGNKKNKKNRDLHTNKTTITVTVPTLSEISASVGASVDVKGHMKVSNNFEVECSTGGSVRFVSLNGVNVEIDCSTGSEAEIYKIACSNLDIESSTGASVSVSEGRVPNVKCEASTGASISLGDTRISNLKKSSSTGGSVRGGSTAR